MSAAERKFEWPRDVIIEASALEGAELLVLEQFDDYTTLQTRLQDIRPCASGFLFKYKGCNFPLTKRRFSGVWLHS